MLSSVPEDSDVMATRSKSGIGLQDFTFLKVLGKGSFGKVRFVSAYK